MSISLRMLQLHTQEIQAFMVFVELQTIQQQHTVLYSLARDLVGSPSKQYRDPEIDKLSISDLIWWSSLTHLLREEQPSCELLCCTET